ncbi:serine aminopeptidase domain-containing protein [Tundrisphaera sp. TA3]|uniref:serine aminopeptidase domain-containing protein n=1 Tax=Tundrisphaera sp. TA3 TaxID=3435775 RepID=UPI003EB971A9
MIHNELITKLFRAWKGKPSLLPDGESSALVLMADGCGGLDLGQLGLRHAMRKGGPASVRFRPVRWGHGVGHWHADLTDACHHEAGAAMMAGEVRAWRERRPGVPVYLVGKSGGAWIVAQALERLPADAVEVAVLLAPAMSPNRDLSRALRAVRREMVVFWSPLDALVLGAGTWLFGTADRVRSVSAGLVGFRQPPGLDGDGAVQYRKLRQVRWRAAMAASGHLGGHVGPDNPAFLRKYVVPLLRPDPGVKS